MSYIKEFIVKILLSHWFKNQTVSSGLILRAKIVLTIRLTVILRLRNAKE